MLNSYSLFLLITIIPWILKSASSIQKHGFEITGPAPDFEAKRVYCDLFF
jgi:hypothetical protein